MEYIFLHRFCVLFWYFEETCEMYASKHAIKTYPDEEDDSRENLRQEGGNIYYAQRVKYKQFTFMIL